MKATIGIHTFRVLDVETTGLNRKTDAVVELAWAIMRGDGTVLSSNSTLINPERPIPADASKVHGIFDRDVAEAPTLEEAIAAYPELCDSVLPAVCHNASFDSAFLCRSRQFTNANPRFLCTLRLAENLIPNCASYRLAFLRQHLRLDAHAGTSSLHRGESDVATTCSLLKHLIDRYLAAGHSDDVEGLFQLSMIQSMPFGKHKGQPLSEVPLDYIDWLLGRDVDDDLRAALIQARKGSLAATMEPDQPGPSEPKRRPWWWPF